MKKVNIIKNIINYSKKIIKNRKKTIVIVAPYFNKERLKDGYFKRVKAVDELFKDFYKVYVTYENPKKVIQFEEKENNTLIITYNSDSRKQKFIISWIMMICGRIYCHSVWQARIKFFKIPFLKVYVDVHGVVPEEETLYGRYEDAQIYGDIEEVVVQKAECLICVSNKLIEHLKSKYNDKFKAKTIILPIFDMSLSNIDMKKKKINSKPNIIYAGGIMKWQKIELMQESIKKQLEDNNFIICVPNPDEFYSTWKYEKKHKNLTVTSKTYEDLCKDVYSIADYGYVLRDDIVVNNVACPTKIAEYLKYKIIPIVKTPNIGDFSDLGMQYITLEDFNNGKRFSEKKISEIINNNLKVLEKYLNVHIEGKKKFIKLFER